MYKRQTLRAALLTTIIIMIKFACCFSIRIRYTTVLSVQYWSTETQFPGREFSLYSTLRQFFPSTNIISITFVYPTDILWKIPAKVIEYVCPGKCSASAIVSLQTTFIQNFKSEMTNKETTRSKFEGDACMRQICWQSNKTHKTIVFCIRNKNK